MTVSAVLYLARSDDDRVSERYRVQFGAVLADGAVEGVELTILDISMSGFLMETDQPLPIGSQISVELPDAVARDAQIVWKSGYFHGAEFEGELNPTELRNILAASPVVWPHFSDESRPMPSDRRGGENQIEDISAEVGAEEKLPFATRGRVIIGITALLWVAIASGIWLTIG